MGAYIWRGLYIEGLIFGVLWYLSRFTVNRISILAILVINRLQFFTLVVNWVCFFRSRRSYSSLSIRPPHKSPSQTIVNLHPGTSYKEGLTETGYWLKGQVINRVGKIADIDDFWMRAAPGRTGPHRTISGIIALRFLLVNPGPPGWYPGFRLREKSRYLSRDVP